MRARDHLLDSEPRISEMLDDPVIQAVMTRDRVARNEILDLVVSMRARLGVVPSADAAAA